MTDFAHLHALEESLRRERERYALDASELRAVWIAQKEREIAGERALLGLDELIMTNDELLAELNRA